MIANDKLCVRRVDATGEIGAFQGEKRIFCGDAVYFRPKFDKARHFLGPKNQKFMFKPISTTDLCDAFLRNGTTDFAIMPPVFKHFGGRKVFAGPVRTVQCFEDNFWVKAALEEPGWVDTPEGRVAQVLVVDGGASLRRALVGGNIAALAARNGWAGVVVDGCVRDVHELAAADVGICALGLMPMPTVKRQTGQRDTVIQMQGVRVLPGHWLYADEDGIVLCSQAVSPSG